MKLRIYQVSSWRASFAEFLPYSKIKGNVCPENYDLVFEGELKNCRTLESVFGHFAGRYSPKPPCMRPFAVSDVVELIEPCGKTPAGFYFCDSIGFGFKRIDFDASLTEKRDNCVLTVGR